MSFEVQCVDEDIKKYADKVKANMLEKYGVELENIPVYFIERLCENYALEFLAKGREPE